MQPTLTYGKRAACSRRSWRRVPISFPLTQVLFLASACVSTDEAAAPSDAIHIGTVLPFSGERASSGVALESAMRLAVDTVNAGKGFSGQSLWLDLGDSHSDDTRGTANALALLDQGTMPFFIGTEEPKIAFQITDAIKAHQMVHLMPGLTSAQFHDPSAKAAWFRLSPSVSYLACALAKHMRADGIERANLLIDPDDYSSTFATIFTRVFTANGGTALPTLIVASQGGSMADLFATLARFSPDASALITSPSVAAGILQEWAVRGKPNPWYLGPTLRNPELLRNVPMGVLEGIQGISADLGDRADDFERFFETNTGIPPLAGSHYYFDAVALLALASTEAFAETGSLPGPAAVKDHMLRVTSPGGTVVAFDQLAQGMALLSAGQKVQYQGAAGFYTLNSLGDTTQNRGVIWKIEGTHFSQIDYLQCVPSEVESGAGSH